MRIQIPETSCCRYVRDKDTVTLKEEKFPTVATCSLTYTLHEKDRNVGTLERLLKGDKLIADYIFFQESTTYTRQVVFLIQTTLLQKDMQILNKHYHLLCEN